MLLAPASVTPAMLAGHGGDLAGMCASRDGAHVVTWDAHGVFRRWAVTTAPACSP